MEYNIALVPGDGIGKEITPAGLEILKKTARLHGFTITTEEFGYGAGYYKSHGCFMPPNGLDTLQSFNAILFGAVGLPDVDDTLPAKDSLRFEPVSSNM